MDYIRTREDAVRRRLELTKRLAKIAEDKVALHTEEQQMQRELAALDQILEAVDFFQSDQPIEGEPSGMADHIRRLVQQTPGFLLPTQIRDSLTAVGITGSSPQNNLIGVHNVLTRLKPFLKTEKINGRTAYGWKREAEQAGRKASPSRSRRSKDIAT